MKTFVVASADVRNWIIPRRSINEEDLLVDSFAHIQFPVQSHSSAGSKVSRRVWSCTFVGATMKHNNEIPNNHFRKEWDLRVRTWFDQPARKLRRRKARAAKAARIAPRPIDGALRPIVRCQTVKYNRRARLGRGFSLEELKEAEIPIRLAPTIGIAVDHRRKNRSVEGMQTNVQRLKEYKAKLIVFPRKAGKRKSGDSDEATLALAKQLSKNALFPLSKPKMEITVEPIKPEDLSKPAYASLRVERANKRYKGKRDKRAAEETVDKEEKKK